VAALIASFENGSFAPQKKKNTQDPKKKENFQEKKEIISSLPPG
jgi:hypothetical protein